MPDMLIPLFDWHKTEKLVAIQRQRRELETRLQNLQKRSLARARLEGWLAALTHDELKLVVELEGHGK